MEFDKPSLIEPGMKYFLKETLKQCHVFRETYYNTVFNSGLLILFFVILGLILLYKYKGKLTPKEIEMKNREKQQYILSKIKNYQDTKLRETESLITGLPKWE
jgi:hypothetical protein